MTTPLCGELNNAMKYEGNGVLCCMCETDNGNSKDEHIFNETNGVMVWTMLIEYTQNNALTSAECSLP